MTVQAALAPLLLDMLSSERAVLPMRLAALSDADWDALAEMVGQHRLGPLLHDQIARRGNDWPVPAAQAARWERSYRHAAQRALAVERALGEVGALIDAEGMAYAALKGAWLAWHGYANPALRPMRDIDVLLSQPDAERLYGMMAAAGAVPGRFSHTPLAFARDHHKHLPPLHWGPRKISFEIHWRLTNPKEGEAAEAVAAEVAALLARRVRARVGAAEIAYLDPTDSLLHLVVHAAYGRQPFDNGPQVLHDLAGLIDSAAVDWPRFWDEARRHGWRDGARLLFALVAKYLGARDTADPETAPVPDAMVTMAEGLMLHDMAARAEHGFATRLAEAEGVGSKAALMLRRAFPPRHIVAHYAGLPPSSWRVLPWYPVRMAGHAWHWLRRRGDAAMGAQVADARAMRAWLGTGPG